MARQFYTAIGILWLAAALLTLVNRGPFYFADTTAYVRTADAAMTKSFGFETVWSDRLQVLMKQTANRPLNAPPEQAGSGQTQDPNARVTPLAGRSVYYGLFLYIADQIGSLWLAALAQCLIVGIALVLAGRLLAPRMRLGHWAGLGLVTILSGAGAYAGLLMPDIFAALAILSSAIVVNYWGVISRGEQVFWWCLLTASVLSHSATLLIVGAIFAVALASRMGGKRFHKPLFTAMLIGVAGELLFVTAVKYATGEGPLRPPFLSARLIADGPGKQYLSRRCPDAGWAVCDHFRELPENSDSILWNKPGPSFITADPDSQRNWSRQDVSFAASVIADDPVPAVAALGTSIMKQATSLGLGDVTQPSLGPQGVPETKRGLYLQTLASRGAFDVKFLDVMLLILLSVSVIILAVSARRREFGTTIWIVAAGIVANVIICGAMSTPHDRYLTRVVWLLPILAVFALVNRATATSGSATTGEALTRPNRER